MSPAEIRISPVRLTRSIESSSERAFHLVFSLARELIRLSALMSLALQSASCSSRLWSSSLES